MSVTYQAESLAQFIPDALPLMRKHYAEVAHYQDIEFEPDWDKYLALEAAGSFRAFTARDFDGSLIGYACFFVHSNLHYKSSLQAVQDVIYIDPTVRGFGRQFIDWCDSMLAGLGVQVVYHHVKCAKDFSPALVKLGYEKIEHIYGRRLDGGNNG
jgi:hypothetical protein